MRSSPWYGRFDPLVFGIRLRLAVPSVQHEAGERMQFALSSFAIPHFLLQPEYLFKLTDEMDIQDALLTFTSAIHETKHFHDLLSTPYGIMLARHFSRLALLCIGC